MRPGETSDDCNFVIVTQTLSYSSFSIREGLQKARNKKGYKPQRWKPDIHGLWPEICEIWSQIYARFLTRNMHVDGG